MKKYYSYKSDGGIIELQLPMNITTVITPIRLQQWANDLEKAYHTFAELTNYRPYKTIIVEAYKPATYWGYVIEGSNIIHIDCHFLYQDLKKMAKRKNDWNFCVLHEMGHIFDFYRSWCFEPEMMTDLKVAYVLEMNGAAAAPSEFAETECFYGMDIMRAYDKLGTDLSSSYNVFGCVHRFLQIEAEIGWGAFKKVFHYLQKNNDKYMKLSKREKFENFIYALTLYSKKDIKSYFTPNEWETITNQLD